MKRDVIEFITNMVFIGSFSYWINSILIHGFKIAPISILSVVMVIFIYIIFKNLNVENVEQINFSIFNKNLDIVGFFIFMIIFLFLDSLFYFMNTIL